VTAVPRPRLSSAQIITERFSDTAYDIYLHYARLARLRKDTRKGKTRGGRVVVLGSGWGAHSLIKVIDSDEFDSVTMLSPRNYFVSHSSLPVSYVYVFHLCRRLARESFVLTLVSLCPGLWITWLQLAVLHAAAVVNRRWNNGIPVYR
jgi:hypothetical protein